MPPLTVILHVGLLGVIVPVNPGVVPTVKPFGGGPFVSTSFVVILPVMMSPPAPSLVTPG
jgi:hypothetical protein